MFRLSRAEVRTACGSGRASIIVTKLQGEGFARPLPQAVLTSHGTVLM
jgi:hypothetical protein